MRHIFLWKKRDKICQFVHVSESKNHMHIWVFLLYWPDRWPLINHHCSLINFVIIEHTEFHERLIPRVSLRKRINTICIASNFSPKLSPKHPFLTLISLIPFQMTQTDHKMNISRSNEGPSIHHVLCLCLKPTYSGLPIPIHIHCCLEPRAVAAKKYYCINSSWQWRHNQDNNQWL